MKTNIFTNKLKKYLSIKPQTVLDLSSKKKNRDFSIKRKKISNKNNKDEDEELSSAYKNINLIISNCLESIKAEEKKEKTIIKPYKKDINYLIKKTDKSSLSNVGDKDSSNLKNLNNTISLSNSNIVLKHSNKNILNDLNYEPERKFTKTKIVKSNIKKTISMNYNNTSLKNKLGNLLHKNSISLFAPKRSFTKQKHLNFNKNKIEKEYKLDLSKEKNSIVSSKFEKSILNSNLMSPKALKISNISRKSKRGINNNERYIKEKTFFISKNNLIKKEKNQKKSKRNSFCSQTKVSHKNSNIESNAKNSQISKSTPSKKRKRSKSILLTTNIGDNIIVENTKRNSLYNKNNKIIQRSSKDNLKILTLKEIEKNVRRTIIEFDREKIKKQLSELEKNNYSETIKNMQKKDVKENNLNITNNSNKTEINETSIIDKEKSLLSESKEEICGKIGNLQTKYRKLFISKKVYDSLDDEEIEDEEEINNFYFPTNSPYVYFIDSLTLISSFIELFYLPFLLAYYKPLPISSSISINSLIFYFIDFIYIIDLILCFFRAYYDFDEFLIRNISSISINYLKGWFFLDLIEAINYYIIFHLRKTEINLNLFNKD